MRVTRVIRVMRATRDMKVMRVLFADGYRTAILISFLFDPDLRKPF